MTRQRLTVHDAARRLEISEDAVRMRIKRGNLDAEKEGNRLFVLLDEEPDPEPTHDPQAALVDELRRQNEYLRGQLDDERQARTEERRRADTVIAQLTSRIPQLDAPSEPRESPETATEEPTRTEGRAGDQEPSERRERSWWRRIWR